MAASAAATTSATLQLQPSALFSRLHSPRLLLLHRRRRFLLSSSGTTTQIHSCNPESARRRSTWLAGWSEPSSSSLPKSPTGSFDYRKGLSSDDDDFGTSRASGSSTMASIVEKLKKFGYIDDSEAIKERPLPEKGSVEDVFHAEDGILPDARGGLSLDLSEKARFPWERKNAGEVAEGKEREATRKRSKTSLAELTLPAGELRRLRHLAIRIKSKMKIGGAGVTREIVDLIHEKWRTDEVVRLKCEGPPALNMKRMHEILERKTGGLVIWRSGTSISLYRGVAYEDLQLEKKKQFQSIRRDENSFDMSRPSHSIDKRENISNSYMHGQYRDQANPPDQQNDDELPRQVKYEVEIDKLLGDLGPRYTDWPGGDPLPVDADLLPGTISGYKPPFRVLPYGVRKSLGLREGTTLRRLARALPPHFALGRSRQHEGLAAAIVKLWEKSSIAKIALKRGVQLTTSERMAEDIKKLTGGTMLSRSKDYIVFYRGKDFLAPEVTEALLERERIAKSMQDEEEQARLRASISVGPYSEQIEQPGIAGSLGETLEAHAKWGSTLGNDHTEKIRRDAEIAKHADLVRKLERKLSLAERKLSKASKALAKVEDSLRPAENTKDPETISDEERFMFRKLGLRMKAFLLLGRRGVFDGTVENMHLHWKYRELVKIIVKVKTFDQVKNIALSLEAESGGVLVSVDKISKGFAIIVYRGKDYSRPSILRPRNLLTKRKALARSIELQRRKALSRHISHLQKNVEQLKYELDQMENVKGQGDEELYTRLNAAYSTENEDSEEDEDEESYFNALSKADNDLDVGEDGDSEDEDDNSGEYDETDCAQEEEEDDFKNKFYSSMNSDNDLDFGEGDDNEDEDDNFGEYDETESSQEEDDFKDKFYSSMNSANNQLGRITEFAVDE